MPAKNPPTETVADLNLATLATLFNDEDAARDFLESFIWPNGPVCPHCQSTEAYSLTARAESKSPVRKGVYKCKKCRQQFTVRIGTIFEDTKIPFTKWLMTIHLMTSSKKGVSSLQISRELGITVKSAWFMTHRIREAMRQTWHGRLWPKVLIVASIKPALKKQNSRLVKRDFPDWPAGFWGQILRLIWVMGNDESIWQLVVPLLWVWR